MGSGRSADTGAAAAPATTAAAASVAAGPATSRVGWLDGRRVGRHQRQLGHLDLAYDLLRDAGGNFVFKSTGLYLRGDSEEAATVDRAAVEARMEYRLTPRLSAFALTGYARDRFKDIQYLVTQTAGLSYALLPAGRVEWRVDGSAGVVVEKDSGFAAETDGALLAGERFVFNVNDRTRITNAATGLWKMGDLEDAYYTFSLGVATSLAGKLELKVEFLNTYKHQLTDPDLEKNDQSIVLAVVYKF